MTFEVQDSLRKVVEEGDVPKSVDGLAFELMYLGSNNLTAGKKYKLLARYKNTTTLYSDVLLELKMSVL